MEILNKLGIAFLVFILITVYQACNLTDVPVKDFIATMLSGVVLVYIIIVLYSKSDVFR